ncbi:hypothetical protein PHMEG_00026833 [Phytophthora megakarya]|uniref:Uncharacterized protein n=1 Tax=Phytophthora megakarya TaxID=4795 RepID=A0A225V9G4_9STRA|nr:hypothetical protein PHMEG_00026833 [Phytophthora megakarya]
MVDRDLGEQYLADRPTYTDEQFRRPFCMSKRLFLYIVESLGQQDSYFTWQTDCMGKLGVHPTIKVAASLRMLAYGCSADSLDELFSIDESTNCPSSWRGAFKGASKNATVVLEAVATADLHICHAFVGMPGINNDLNIHDASPLIAEYLDDNASQFSYDVNDHSYDFLYYLTDGIYPNWKCCVKTLSAPLNE